MKTLSTILSGGKSRRMGKNKALLAFEEETAIERIAKEMDKVSDHIIVISNHPEAYPMLRFPIFKDIHPDLGPLAGLESAMKNTDADIYFLTACDMPFISGKIYEYLLKQIDDCDVVIPIFNGREHPLSGVYRRNILEFVEKNITEGILSMRSLYKELKVKYVTDFSRIATSQELDRHFFNMNRPEEYVQALDILNGLK